MLQCVPSVPTAQPGRFTRSATTQGLHVRLSLFVTTSFPRNVQFDHEQLSSLDLFDHPGTVFYAVFMSFWGKFLLIPHHFSSSLGARQYL